MKNKIFVLLLLFFILIDISLIFYYFSQKPQKNPAPTQAEIINQTLPNITVIQAQYDKSSLDNSKITGKIILKNDENLSVTHLSVVTELRRIITDKKVSELINREVDPALLEFKPLESKTITFSHKIPQNTNDGDYFFEILILNQTGLTISSNPHSFNNIKGKNKFLEIDWQDSKIIQDNQEKFSIEGATFPAKSQPHIVLTVKNPHGFPINAQPHFIIYPRAQTAGVQQVKDYREDKINFTPDSEKRLEFILPAFETPESYLLNLQFIDLSGEPVSGIADFRWVIEGPGGKILSLKLSKAESFFKTTTATITASVIGPPDLSGVKNAQLQLKLFSSDGKKNLLGKFSQTVNINAQSTNIVFPVKFSSNLLSNPNILIQAELMDQNSDVVFHTVQEKIQIIIDASNQNQFILVAIILLFAAVILFIFLKKRRFHFNTGQKYLIVFTLLISGVFLYSQATSVFGDTWSDPGLTCQRTATGNTGQSCADTQVYQQPQFLHKASLSTNTANWGDPITLKAEVELTACNNGTSIYNYSVDNSDPGMISWGPAIRDSIRAFHQDGTVQQPSPGNKTVSVAQTVGFTTPSNCFPGCNSQHVFNLSLTIKGQWFYCNINNDYYCDSAGFYTSQAECEATGKPCYTDWNFCKTACNELYPTLPPLNTPDEVTGSCSGAQYYTCDFGTDRCIAKDCDELNCPYSSADNKCDPNDTCSSDRSCTNIVPIGSYKKCQDGACVQVPDTSGNKTDECSQSSQCTGEPPPESTHLACAARGDAAFCEITSGGGADQCSPEGIACFTNGWPNWDVKSGFPSCGPSQQERSCSCNGPCCGIAPNTFGCQADQDGPFGSCNSKQSRSACFSQRPNNTPDITSVTQPTTALGSTNHNGGSVIQSLDIAVFWKFQEGDSSCNKPWGFKETSNFSQTGQCNNTTQQNKFVIKIYNASGTVIETKDLIPPINQNGNKNYSLNTINQKITTAGNYTVDVCANNGYGERCYSEAHSGQRFSFIKTKIPSGVITGQLIEHYNYILPGGGYCAAPGVSTLVQLQLIRQYPNTPGLPSSLDCLTSGLVKVDGISKITNYTCTVDYNNITVDIPTIDNYQGSIDYLNQTLSLQLKQPVPGYNEYYCPRTNNNNNYCNQANLNNNDKCTNNNSIEFSTSGPPPKNEFDQNDTATPPTSQTINVLFDILNTGTNAGNYYKMKNGQFRSLGNIYSPFPANSLPYDSEDNGGAYLLTGQEGSPLTSPFDSSDSSLGSGINNGARQTNALLDISFKKWENNNYSGPTALPFTPANLLELIKSRKKYKTISSFDDITATDKIYLYNSANDVSLPSNKINQDGILLIVNFTQPSKTLTLMPNGTKFNTSSKSILIATNGTLKFDPSMDEANGVFFGQIVDLGDNTSSPPPLLPLKIKGNLISVQPINTNPLKRTRTDNQKPSLFVVFDAKPYMELLPYLSTTAYQWNELVP